MWFGGVISEDSRSPEAAREKQDRIPLRSKPWALWRGDRDVSQRQKPKASPREGWIPQKKGETAEESMRSWRDHQCARNTTVRRSLTVAGCTQIHCRICKTPGRRPFGRNAQEPFQARSPLSREHIPRLLIWVSSLVSTPEKPGSSLEHTLLSSLPSLLSKQAPAKTTVRHHFTSFWNSFLWGKGDGPGAPVLSLGLTWLRSSTSQSAGGWGGSSGEVETFL